MKHASVQATPTLQLIQREDAPDKPKIAIKKGIRQRSHRFAKLVRHKGIQTEAIPAEVIPVEAALAEIRPVETPPVVPTLKRMASEIPVGVPKIKKVEVVRPTFYTPTPIPLLNRIKAQRELIDRERQRLLEMHNRRVTASAIAEPIIDIFANDLAVDDETYEEWLLSDIQ